MKYIVLLILMTSLKSSVLAQYNILTENTKAEKIISVNFQGRLDSSKYLLYNLEDKYLVIEKRNEGYMLFFIKEGIGKEDSICINKRNKTLRIAFDPESCAKIITNKSSDTLTAHPHSRFIYFFLRDKEMRYCEFILPALFKENVNGSKVYPLNERVHGFLLKKMFTHWKD